MASQCVPLAVCESVFTIGVLGRVIEGGRMSDGYTPRNEGTSFSVQSICAVSIIKSLLKQCTADLYAQVIIFEVQQTRDSFGKWLVKPKFQSYIALVGKRNVTFGGCTIGRKVKKQHEIPRYKHAVCYLQPRVRLTYSRSLK